MMAFEPSNFSEAMGTAEQLFKSGLLGKGISKPEAAVVVILAGRELGLTMMQSLRSIHLIEGKVSLSADLMVALVKRSPLCKYFRLVESTAKIATYETERVGEGVTQMSFTILEAQTAKLLGKDNWTKYPAAMLRARCISILCRAIYSDVTMGIYDPDELSPEPVEVSPRYLAPAPSPGRVALAGEIVDASFDDKMEGNAVADLETRAAAILAAIVVAETMDDLRAVRELISKDPAVEEMKGRASGPYETKRIAVKAIEAVKAADTEAAAALAKINADADAPGSGA